MMANTSVISGQTAIQSKGWLLAHKWLLLRRVSQIGILLLFISGPWFGIWIVKGNLSSSLTLEVLPLTDPYLLLQSLVAGHSIVSTALIGAALVTLFYIIFGGRVFCSFVCPINMVTDAASRLRQIMNIKGGAHFNRNTRYWILLMTLVVAVVTSSIAWELVNPVSLVHRGIIFGSVTTLLIMAALFLFDFVISRHGWCGHLCPVGAFYSLLAKYSIIRVSAVNRERCDDCLDCYRVCPEEQVINPALKGAGKGNGPVILDLNCTNCGRCIDVCAKDVFRFSTRFKNSMLVDMNIKKEVAP